jgi:hypothetical protein
MLVLVSFETSSRPNRHRISVPDLRVRNGQNAAGFPLRSSWAC